MSFRLTARQFLRTIITKIVPGLVITTLLWVLIVLSFGQPSSEVWLPRDSDRIVDKDYVGISSLSLIDHSKSTLSWRYGRGMFYQRTDGFSPIYEAHASRLLKPSACPNVFHETENVSPSGCVKEGSIHGLDVYAIDRSLPMGITDIYAVLGNTFVASQAGYGPGDSGNLDYFAKYVQMTHSQATQLLARNKKESTAAAQKTKIAENREKQAEAAAYKGLSFTPVLPSSLPDGWVGDKSTIEGETPPAKALFISTGYSKNFHKKGELDVGLYITKLEGYTLGSFCGPTITAGTQLLPCQPVSGTSYYEAWYTGDTSPNDTDFVDHYLYVPIGDALAQLDTGDCCSTSSRSAISSKALQAQRAIADALRPVSLDSFKNAEFDPYGRILAPFINTTVPNLAQ